MTISTSGTVIKMEPKFMNRNMGALASVAMIPATAMAACM